MKSEDVDRILSKEEEILPSAGFVDSVMASVRREAVVPAPIPFPWRRALPLLAVGGLSFAFFVVASLAVWVRGVAVPQATPWWTSELLTAVNSAAIADASWTVVVLLISYASVKFSMQLAMAKV